MKMKSHPLNHHRLAGLYASLALAATTPMLHAGDPAAEFSIEAGPAMGKYESSGGDADLLGYAAGVQWELGKLLITDFGLRADYLHLESQDNVAFQRDEFDLDARFGVSLVGFLNPYVGAGVSLARNKSPGYTPETDWVPGFGLGAGVGITILPGLLHTTPSIRYAEFEDLRTMTYTLDTALHFTVVGVGLRLNYEDNLSRDGDVMSGILYAAFRF